MEFLISNHRDPRGPGVNPLVVLLVQEVPGVREGQPRSEHCWCYQLKNHFSALPGMLNWYVPGSESSSLEPYMTILILSFLNILIFCSSQSLYTNF